MADYNEDVNKRARRLHSAKPTLSSSTAPYFRSIAEIKHRPNRQTAGRCLFYSRGFFGQRKTTAMTNARKQTVPNAANCTVSGRPGSALSTFAKPANGSRSDIMRAPSRKKAAQSSQNDFHHGNRLPS